MLDCQVPSGAVAPWIIFAIGPAMLGGWLTGRRSWQSYSDMGQSLIIGCGVVAVIYSTCFAVNVWGCGEGLVNAVVRGICYFVPAVLGLLLWGLGRPKATANSTTSPP